MEAKDKYNISKIETRLYALLKGTVSNNVFVGTLPSVLEDTWSDAVVVDFGTDVLDMDAYADGRANILLYARPLSDGTKNVAKMSKLEVALNTVLNGTHDSDFVTTRASMMADYDTNINWHCNIVTINIRIY